MKKLTAQAGAVGMGLTAEELRLEEARDKGIGRRDWGPYLSERQWGTVREDYSDSGDAWDYFTHDQARLRAYRWGEDGLAGISDHKQRLFGLTNSEGNHSWEGFVVFAWEDAAAGDGSAADDGETPAGRLLVAVNYQDERAQCYVPLPPAEPAGHSVRLVDLLSPAVYERQGDELLGRGLYLDVPAWGHHAFKVTADGLGPAAGGRAR